MDSFKPTGNLTVQAEPEKNPVAVGVGALIVSIIISLSAASACRADSGNEIGAGIGMDYDSQNIRQGFVYIGREWDSQEYGFLGYRLEGDLDVISNGSSVVIGTIMPAARLYVPTDSGWRPFLDVGAGLSLKHGDLVGGRHLSGPIAFTLMSALGVEYKTAGGRRLSLSTRFRHISNSGLYSRNQGFNAQYIVLSVGF